MANALPLRQILTTLQAALVAGFVPESIGGERPRAVANILDIVVTPSVVDRRKDGPESSFTDTHEQHHFSFRIRMKMPAAAGDPDLTIPLIKCDIANQIYACVMVRQLWASLCNFPIVTEVAFPDVDNLSEGTIEVTGKFTCETGTSWF